MEKPVRKIESEMSGSVIYGAYSAYKFRFNDIPSDYSEVYVYAEKEEIERRFPSNSPSPHPNLFVLKYEGKIYGNTTTLGQIFVDLWNLKEWYAHEFLKALEEKIYGLLE